MAQVKFIKGTTTLTFTKNPLYPIRRTRQASQVYGQTEAGQTFVYDKGIRSVHHELEFRRLPEGDLNALKDFIENDIAYGLYTFLYYDEDGTAHTVRLEEPRMDFEEEFFGVFSGRLVLREELT